MKRFLPKNYLLYVAIFVFMVFIFLLILLFNASPSSQNNTAPIITPTPVLRQPQASAPAIGELPREGAAIDTDAPIVHASEQEVGKARRNLPYLHDFVASTGQEVSIVIPSVQYQDDPWKLTVNIFGPDYSIPRNNANYEKEKQTFLDGANEVFRWIESTGADPNKTIIKWGDKAYIQQKAEEWLKES